MTKYLYTLLLAVCLVACGGTVGTPGDRGEQGVQGEQGAMGEQGYTGPRGASAKLESFTECITPFEGDLFLVRYEIAVFNTGYAFASATIWTTGFEYFHSRIMYEGQEDYATAPITIYWDAYIRPDGGNFTVALNRATNELTIAYRDHEPFLDDDGNFAAFDKDYSFSDVCTTETF